MARRRPAGWLRLATLAALAAPLAVFVGAFGTLFGWWPIEIGYDLLTWRIGWVLAWVGMAAALAAVVLALRDARRLGWMAAVALLAAGPTLGLFLHHQSRIAAASAVDVSTDVSDPPGLSRRQLDQRAAEGAMPVNAPAAVEACPGLSAAPTQVAVETADQALRDAGFTVAATGVFRAEGTKDGFWFGRGHDVVVRIRPGRTDVRVIAHDPRPDGGEACRLAKAVVQGLSAGQ